MQALVVQHPKDAFVDVGICERTKRPIRLCYNEFVGTGVSARSSADSADATAPAQPNPVSPPLPNGMVRESDIASTPTAEDVATGAAPSFLPVILLIMGVASPGLFWDDRFCSALSQSGPYRVIRFDNRDVGLSTHLDDDTTDGLGVDAAKPSPTSSSSAAVREGAQGEEARRGRAASSSVPSFFSNVLGRAGRQSRGSAQTSAGVATDDDRDHHHQNSTHAPDYLRFAYAALKPGKRVIPEMYAVEDMAKDTLGLMDALNVRTAHVVGMCLGGIIAQCMALRAPERIASLTLFATHTSDTHGVKWPSMMTMLSMIRCAPRTSIYAKYKPLIEAAGTANEKQRLERERDAARAAMYAEALTKLLEVLAGDKDTIGFDRSGTRKLMTRAFTRSLYVAGSSRQVVATLNASPRGDVLRRTITSLPNVPSATAGDSARPPRYVPTIIVQGTKDAICPAENARELSECIPGSRVVWLDGCGHVLPPAYRESVLQAVQSVVREGERAKAASSTPGAVPTVRSHL